MFIYGTAWKKERTKGLVQLALENGFRAIDTANQLKHYNEVGVGEALKEWFQKGHSRDELFLQTKFTPRDGQDHRLPYNEDAPIAEQVLQSFQSSLEHLGVETLDSYLLHGPYNSPSLGDEDWEAWEAIESLFQSKKTKKIGISNVNPIQLELLIANAKIKPQVVQNRCFAQRGWDDEARKICQAHGIMYQGFSLLTANPFVLEDPFVLKLAKNYDALPTQIVFAFCHQAGMTPLTGTSSAQHMQQDLAAEKIKLSTSELDAIATVSIR